MITVPVQRLAIYPWPTPPQLRDDREERPPTSSLHLHHPLLPLRRTAPSARLSQLPLHPRRRTRLCNIFSSSSSSSRAASRTETTRTRRTILSYNRSRRSTTTSTCLPKSGSTPVSDALLRECGRILNVFFVPVWSERPSCHPERVAQSVQSDRTVCLPLKYLLTESRCVVFARFSTSHHPLECTTTSPNRLTIPWLFRCIGLD